MGRGELGRMANTSYYESNKKWIVEPIRVERCWYDLIVNPHEQADTKKLIVDNLKGLATEVEKQLDKRFIYFITSRKRIRFSTKKKAKYTSLGSKLVFYIEIGKERKLKKLSTKFYDPVTDKPIKPEFFITDRFISIAVDENNLLTIAVHDFLAEIGVDLGLSSKVYYVGYTKRPWKRPLDGNHRGLSDTLYKIDREDCDVFIYYTLFKVTSIAEDPERKINYVIANSMIDEIKVDEEGLLLEKCLICYFQAESQVSNHDNEKKELENTLVRLAEENKINSISVDYELEHHSEYFQFYSNAVLPSHQHAFTCSVNDGALTLTRGISDMDFNLHSEC